jgi:hypothetical protein
MIDMGLKYQQKFTQENSVLSVISVPYYGRQHPQHKAGSRRKTDYVYSWTDEGDLKVQGKGMDRKDRMRPE